VGWPNRASWNANDGMAVTGCIADLVAIGTFLRLVYMLQRLLNKRIRVCSAIPKRARFGISR
jgi:hypothetical protein